MSDDEDDSIASESLSELESADPDSSSSSSASESSDSSSSSSSSSSSDVEELEVEAPGVDHGHEGAPKDLLLIESELSKTLCASSNGGHLEEKSLLALLVRRMRKFLKENMAKLHPDFRRCIVPCSQILTLRGIATNAEVAVLDLENLSLEEAALRLDSLLEKVYCRIKAAQLQHRIDTLQSAWRGGKYCSSLAQSFLELALLNEHRGELEGTSFDLPHFMLRAWQVMAPTQDELQSLRLPLDFPTVGLETWLQKDYEAKVEDIKTWQQLRFLNKETIPSEPKPGAPMKDKKRRRGGVAVGIRDTLLLFVGTSGMVSKFITNRASENSATVKMTLGPDTMCQTNISGAVTGRSPPDTG